MYLQGGTGESLVGDIAHEETKTEKCERLVDIPITVTHSDRMNVRFD